MGIAALLAVALQGVAPASAAPPAVSGGANAATFISSADYPAAALRNHEEGSVGVRLDIDAAGRVSACTVTQSAGSASLDAETCRLLTRRARFKPAHDETGRPVPDVFNTRITWRIDPDLPPGPVQPALDAWVACLERRVNALVPTAATREAIPDQAFAACTREEAAMIAVANPGAPPVSQAFLENSRGGSRLFVLQMIDSFRRERGH